MYNPISVDPSRAGGRAQERASNLMGFFDTSVHRLVVFFLGAITASSCGDRHEFVGFECQQD